MIRVTLWACSRQISGEREGALLSQIFSKLRGESFTMIARLYRPSRTAMQAGTAKTRAWVLEIVPQHSLYVERIMGWTGSLDTADQIQIKFPDRHSAERFAQARGIRYSLEVPHEPILRPKSYATNFR